MSDASSPLQRLARLRCRRRRGVVGRCAGTAARSDHAYSAQQLGPGGAARIRSGGARNAIDGGSGEPRSAGVLVGHSLGGAACVLAANRAPELLAGLVVVASGVSMPVHPSLWGMLEDGGESAVIRRFAAAASLVDSGGQAASSAAVSRRMEAMMRRAAPGTLTNHLKACDAYRALPRCSAGDSASRREGSARLARALRTARRTPRRALRADPRHGPPDPMGAARPESLRPSPAYSNQNMVLI